MNTPDRPARGVTGQPLRAMGAILLLWIGGRIAANGLFPANSVAGNIGLTIASSAMPTRQLRFSARADLPHPAGSPPPSLASAPIVQGIPIIRSQTRVVAPYRNRMAHPSSSLALTTMGSASSAPSLNISIRSIDVSPANNGRATPNETRFASAPPIPSVPLSPGRPGRSWSGSAWLFARNGGGKAGGIGSAGQLGGSQAGIRVERQVARAFGAMPVAPYARLSSALRQPHMPEAAIGLAIRPFSGRMPLSIGIERRIAFDSDARNAFALVAATGLNPTSIAPDVVAEGYAQAGMVGFARRDAFVDGRISLATPLDTGRRLSAGASVSGGAQPHLSRLDIGPMVQIGLPLRNLDSRLTIEWRERIAGNARPGSGLSVTLGLDF